MSNSENDYSDLVIVAEDQWYSRKQERTTMCIYNTLWEIKEDLDEPNNNTIDRLFCRKFPSERENCHAEVLFISDNVLANKVRKKFIIAPGENKNDPSVAYAEAFSGSVVIRILEDKQRFLKEFDDRSAADVTFVVNGEECKGDRKYLAGVSPVLNAMLYGKFVEAQQDRIELEGIESADIFKDFLLAVSPLRIQPNPSNVVALLKLAHQYDIPFQCHIPLHCYEISTADRILLAGKYGLESLKTCIMQQLSNGDLTEILRNKRDQLREIGSEFLFDVIADRLDE
ncbi:BTB/POZ domain-containing protein [Ditylenchus destructor]|uniref:BTB/POZ domain-containing protein n=1 Tax=Ditylenchus destructor TaxID=166010 RepID=A0AAD4QRP8_9BILA|nr:BTB/POZ domain-containing protein [Ditylenchus destructor]